MDIPPQVAPAVVVHVGSMVAYSLGEQSDRELSVPSHENLSYIRGAIR